MIWYDKILTIMGRRSTRVVNNDMIRRKSWYFTIFSLHHELSPTSILTWQRRSCVQITCNTSGAYHVQHVCHVLRTENSAIDFERAVVAFIFKFISWAETMDRYGEERKPERPEKIFNDELHKTPYTKARTFKLRPKSRPILKVVVVGCLAS